MGFEMSGRMTCETPKRTGHNGWPNEKNHVFQNISLQQTSFTANIVHQNICSATAMKLCNIEELPMSEMKTWNKGMFQLYNGKLGGLGF